MAPLTLQRPLRAGRVSLRRAPMAVMTPAKPAAAVGKGASPVVPAPAELPKDAASLKGELSSALESDVGAVPGQPLSAKATYRAAAASVRKRLIDARNHTQAHWDATNAKHVFYLSAEFLMGRSLTNAVGNLGLEDAYGEAVKSFGYDFEAVVDAEQNAALGNGGLGRLAACFLDSMATLDLPGWGYGIRYKYGMFKQALDAKGRQQELPDVWLTEGNPWEVRRDGVVAEVGFYGSVVDSKTGGKWVPGEVVLAQAYDTPIPGFGTKTMGNLRLWEALPAKGELDLAAFNEGRFVDAAAAARKASEISAVLYPNDATEEGKELRLKQQYFFVSASLQDVLARHAAAGKSWDSLPEAAIFQMNDTHPTCAVSELMRLLIDERGLSWDQAWSITTRCLAFTNHTVMPEALEKWPVAVFKKLLPRNYEIVARVDADWRASIRPQVEADVKAYLAANPPPPPPPKKEKKKEGEKKAASAASASASATSSASSSSSSSSESSEDEESGPAVDPVWAATEDALDRYGILCENPWAPGVKLINMAHLAIVGSSAVNGVAAIHSQILKDDLFKDFYALQPEKFQNKTNGVTPRRWLAFCNPGEAALITEALGSDEWIKDASKLAGLKPFADDAAFRKRWAAVKLENKARLAAKVKELTGVDMPLTSMFDVQIKRIHEYKRQLMNVLSVIARYQEIKATPAAERKAKFVPRSVIFGGKAASAYVAAKKIVRLITAVGAVVNNDPEVGDLLKVVFVPDYNVSLAEVLIPGAELSQHISTAGTEASGTSNMKFAMNGSLIIGTMDGANVEIAEETGAENLFIFGVDADAVPRLREERKDFTDYDPAFLKALKAISSGEFGDREYLQELVNNVSDMTKGNDWFLVANDFASYRVAQAEADACYRDADEWTRRSILMAACSGFFSSDRTIDQYAREIWGVQATPAP